MKKEIALLNDSQLIQLAEELTLASLPEDSLIRTFIPNGSTFALSLIELNCALTQVLAERLIGCSPHIEMESYTPGIDESGYGFAVAETVMRVKKDSKPYNLEYDTRGILVVVNKLLNLDDVEHIELKKVEDEKIEIFEGGKYVGRYRTS